MDDPCESVDLASKWEAINMASQELDAKQEKLSHMRALAPDPPVNIEPIVTMVARLASNVRSLKGFLGSHETQSDMDAVALMALHSRTSRLLARVEAIQYDSFTCFRQPNGTCQYCSCVAGALRRDYERTGFYYIRYSSII